MEVGSTLEVEVNGEEIFMVDKVRTLYFPSPTFHVYKGLSLSLHGSGGFCNGLRQSSMLGPVH